MLKWAREQNCEWDAVTCKAAAQEGHLEVLGGRGSTTATGTRRRVHKLLLLGSWRVLKWAREHDCEWDAVTCACRRI